jgi:hypothetical protein
MTTALVHHRALDYEPTSSSSRRRTSRAAADEASAHPDLPDAFAGAGVAVSSMQIEVVAEVESGAQHERGAPVRRARSPR